MTAERAEPFLMKDMLGAYAIENITEAGAAVSSNFRTDIFKRHALNGLESLSIMERVRHIADALQTALPVEYTSAVEIVRQMAARLGHGFQVIAITEYIVRFGLKNFELSLDVLADVTRFGSAEFAIRPFLTEYPEHTLAVMAQWSHHENEHVRRLASEGCRPRLPWAGRVPMLKKDPTLGFTILEQLRADPSLYVRKSVANHLNDISKDCPDWLLDRLETWPQDNPHTAWIVRQALRTLIKKGEPRALALIGAKHGADIAMEKFTVSPSVMYLGEALTLTFALRSDAPNLQRLVVDYRMHYVRLGGKAASKVFKFKTFDLSAGQYTEMSIRQVVRDMTVRRHFAGYHKIELLVNGQAVATAGFELVLNQSS